MRDSPALFDGFFSLDQCTLQYSPAGENQSDQTPDLIQTITRAFTLAVFLKETLYNDRSDAPLALVIIFLMVSLNVTVFR